jgi:hypothetical protein
MFFQKQYQKINFNIDNNYFLKKIRKIFINGTLFLRIGRSKPRGPTCSHFEHRSQARERFGAYCVQAWENQKAVHLIFLKQNFK